MAKTNPTSNGPTAVAEKTKKVKSGVREKLDTKWHPDLKPDPTTGEPTVKLTAWPADFKTTQHKPLSIKHFEDPSVFYIGKAEKLEKAAAELRQQAETCKQLGGVKDKGSAKKLVNLMKRMDDLKAELSGKGVDVEAMLKLLVAKAQAPVGAPPVASDEAIAAATQPA